MNFFLLIAGLWVCGVKTDPPGVKYFSATGSTQAEAIQNALNVCGDPDKCNLVGCKQISEEQ